MVVDSVRSVEKREQPILIWSSQQSVLRAIKKVLGILLGQSPLCFTERGRFLDESMRHHDFEAHLILVICGDQEVSTISDVCERISFPASIILAGQERTATDKKESLRKFKHIAVCCGTYYDVVARIVSVAQEKETKEVALIPKIGNGNRESEMSYENAEKAAQEVLAIERLQAVRGEWPTVEEIRREAQQSPPILPADPRKLRSQIWHLWKNLLKRYQELESGDEIVSHVYEQLHYWEKVEFGESHPQLEEIGALIKEGKRGKAAVLAEQVYGRLSQRAQEVEVALDTPTWGRLGAKGEKNSRTGFRKLKLFDILIVDDSQIDLSRAKATFQRLAHSCHNYTINIVTVDPRNAFADALHKLKSHPSIQAVVVDWDLAAGEKGKRPGGRTGADLIKKLKGEMPWLYMCLLTGRGVMNVLHEYRDFDVRPYDKHDQTALEEIFSDILQSIKKRERTPFFTALVEYAERPTTVFHALTISRGKSLRKSTWLGDFYDFYGDHVFMAESSTTQPPLDSLFSPRGSIDAAQKMAARVFGSDRTFFITNGTSTANKIVHQAVLKPDDTVLIDRNCHKSHHYGLVLMGARPVYLQAEPLFFDDEFTGICKGVKLDEILDHLEKHPHAKMLCLTNCTFDGYVHDAAKIISAVLNKLGKLRQRQSAGTQLVTKPEDFIFLFDEAWFGFARFVPELRHFTGMFACRDIPKARVYVTQSTHKTLVAFRQGSMIHVRDPNFSEVEHAFEEALFTHSTTSPSYNLIASLDVGRMHADLEGPRLCSEAWGLAGNVRSSLGHETRINKYFHLLMPGEMGAYEPTAEAASAAGVDSEFVLDRTKLTLFLKKTSALTGEVVRRRLLDEFNIQFNKITNNTVLLMVNAGSTESSIGHLVTALRSLASELDCERPAERSEELPSGVFERRVSFLDGNNKLREYFFGQFPASGSLSTVSLDEALNTLKEKAKVLISANFVIPYPPGFPILVPGEIIDVHAVEYLNCLGNIEIHGMPRAGTLKVWSTQKNE